MGKNKSGRRKFRVENGQLVEKVDKRERVVSTPSAPSTLAKRSEEKDAVKALHSKFQLEIPDQVFQKIMWWINKSSHEVSGFGSLTYNEETGLFTVRDVILLKQEVAPTSTEIDPIAIGKAMFRMKDDPMGLKWHWHSHVDMGVFWSGDDRELIRSLGQQGWILASVFNKKREIKTAFHTTASVPFSGMTHDIFVDDVKTYIQRYVEQDLIDQWDKEYQENVFTPAAKVYDLERTHYPSGTGMSEQDWRRLPSGKRGLYATDFNQHGYAVFMEGGLEHVMYNPYYDDILTTRADKKMAIREMEQAEIAEMRERSFSFENLFKEYINEQVAEHQMQLEGGLCST